MGVNVKYLAAMVVLGLASSSVLAAEFVIEISVDGLGGTYLEKLFNGTATGGPYSIPNFQRLKSEGASTFFAHNDNNNWETLPNHTSILTGRPRDGVDGHHWSSNSDPAFGQTLQSNNGGVYIASVFDMAHDNGLRTGLYANKSKFSLFDTTANYTGGGSYGATYGAPDAFPLVAGNNGKDKIDNMYINTTLGGTTVDAMIAQQKSGSPNQFSFVHINETDAAGHGSGWGSATWNSQAVVVDAMIGKIFQMIQDVPAMNGKTNIILTADHGNQDDPPTGKDRYAVPFFVWGPGVKAGADLYTLNSGNRLVAANYPMTTYAGAQPIRNAEASNLALELLGLPSITGSVFDASQDLNINTAMIALTTPVHATIIKGGSANLGATIRNSAGVASDNLDYTLAAAVQSGSAALGSVTSGSGSLLVGGSAIATVLASSSNVGVNTIRFTGSDPLAGNTSQTLDATLTVLDHSSAAFVASGSFTLDLDFGKLVLGQAMEQFRIQNLAGLFRAGLDLDSVVESADATGVFTLDGTLFSNLVAGTSSDPFEVNLDAPGPGQYSGQYLFALSDQNGLSGSTGGQTLTLNVTAEVTPEPSTLMLLGLSSAALLCRRRRV